MKHNVDVETRRRQHQAAGLLLLRFKGKKKSNDLFLLWKFWPKVTRFLLESKNGQTRPNPAYFLT